MQTYNSIYDTHIIHDIIIMSISSIINGLIFITMFINNKLYDISTKIHIFFPVILKILFNRILMHILNFLIGVTIIPIVDLLYPIFDIEKKFDQISNMIKIKSFDNFQDNELTQEAWNNYIIYLKIPNNDECNLIYDIFDVLIRQNIDRVNFVITISINRSDSIPKCITYATFYSKLKDIIGDAIDVQYRYTKNKIFFVGIFEDDSPYRRLRYYDII